MKFEAHEWKRIVKILEVTTSEEPLLKRWLLRQRIAAQENAGLEAKRRRQAADRLRAAKAHLDKVSPALAALLPHDDAQMLDGLLGKLPGAGPTREELVLRALSTLESAQLLPPDPDYAAASLGDSGFALGSLRTFLAEAERLRHACETAAKQLTNKARRPRKAEDQEAVIWRLAGLYRVRRRKRATQSETGEFADLVRNVLGLQKAGNLLATLGGPSPSQRAGAAASRRLLERLKAERMGKTG